MSEQPVLTLKQHRMRAYLTVEQLAKRADVGQHTIWRIQRGELPRISTMWKIADALKVHPSEIREFASAVAEGDTGPDAEVEATR